MRSRDQFREWLKGCSCADHDKPWECGECTLGMLEAVNHSMDEEEAEEQIAKMEGASAMLGGLGLIAALRKLFGAKIDDAMRRELGDVVEARDNAQTKSACPECTQPAYSSVRLALVVYPLHTTS